MTDAAPAAPRTPVFAQKPFRTLWLAQFVSIFGDFLALFGVISLITFRLHGSAVDVTSVTVAYVIPIAIVAPFAGVLVDRWNVRRVMIASDLVRAALALSLVLTTDVRQIALVLAGISVVGSFFAPAQSVTVRTLVAQEDLLAANAALAQAFYAVRIFSPAIAGALVAWLGERACFWLDGGSFLFSAAMIATLVVVRPPAAPRAGTVRALAQDFVAGNRFIFTHGPLAFAFLAMGAAMFVLSSFSPLISIYIRDGLHAGSFTYGAVSAMVGVGLVAGTTVVRRVAQGRPSSVPILGGLFLLGVGAGLLGAFRTVPTAALSTFAMGCGIAFVLVPAQTLSQRETPREMVGRVSSTFISLISFAQAFGLLLSGALAERLGIRGLFLACAALLTLLALAGYLRLRPSATPA